MNQANPCKPGERYDSVGSLVIAIIPPTNENAEAKIKAGSFPDSKIASNGPAPSDKIICKCYWFSTSVVYKILKSRK